MWRNDYHIFNYGFQGNKRPSLRTKEYLQNKFRKEEIKNYVSFGGKREIIKRGKNDLKQNQIRQEKKEGNNKRINEIS